MSKLFVLARFNHYREFQIVGMIEEAAGTRMYEEKKKSAVRTIEKKEGKMAEIKQVLFLEAIIS